MSMPLLDSSIYDCIVDTGTKLVKVQIKSTSKKPDGIHRNSVQTRIANNKQTYTEANVDYFAVYVYLFDGFFIFKNTGDIQTIRLSKVGKHSKKFNNFVFD